MFKRLSTILLLSAGLLTLTVLSLINNQPIQAAPAAQPPPPVDLRLNKTASPTAVYPGETIIYTLDISHTGTALANAVRLTDTLPSNVTVLGVISQVTPPGLTAITHLVNNNTMQVFQFSTISNTQQAAITITVQVNKGTGAGTLNNSATIMPNPEEPPPFNGNNTATANVTVKGCPNGTIAYVDANASGTNSGDSWDNAFTTLQNALYEPFQTACSVNEVWVANGVYYPDEGNGQTNNSITATFQMTDSLAIYGGFEGDGGAEETSRDARKWETNITVLSGDIDGDDTKDSNGIVTDTANIVVSNAYHVVTSEGVTNTAILDGFTITAGSATFNPFGGDNNHGGGLYNGNGSPILANLTFYANQAIESGGGMYNNQGSPSLSTIKFINNKSDDTLPMVSSIIAPNNSALSASQARNPSAYGGGLYTGDGAPTLTNVTFTGNSAIYGGGGMFSSSSDATLKSVTFLNNSSSERGGGLRNSSHTTPSNSRVLSLTDVTFSGNQAQKNGGGFDNSTGGGSYVKLNNVTFLGNQSQTNGGGLYTSGTATLTNILLSGNYAKDNGGAIYNAGSNTSSSFTHMTLSGNKADGAGGALYFTSTSTPTLQNSIIWNNQDSSGSTSATASISRTTNATPIISHSLIANSKGSGASWDAAIGIDGGGNLDADPLFTTAVDPSTAPTISGDLSLQSASPAIDAADSTVCASTDIAGTSRPQRSGCDMGAYESSQVNVYLPLVIKGS